MNILFLTIGKMNSMEDHAIYTDLLRCFRAHGHNVYAVAAREKRDNLSTEFLEENGVRLLQVKIGNITKCGLLEKGISTIRVSAQYINAIKRWLPDIRFDLIMYSTPPLTFARVVQFIKKRDRSKSYLLLKDIFPQNAVDLGIFSPKSFIYRFFRKKEKKLYAISDYIGCMSQANVDYVLRENPTIALAAVHISPNTIEAREYTGDCPTNMRARYGIPTESIVFVYGGNLGRPQGVPFLLDCLEACKDKTGCFFVICGSGTEYSKLKEYIDNSKPQNVLLINGMPRDEYEEFIRCCDVGLIFLDHRFTIPNFPSRLLSYLQTCMPVLACTDPNTDIGRVIENGGFGWWCESNSTKDFTLLVEEACHADLAAMGLAARSYLLSHYTVEKSYEIIMDVIK